MRFRSILLRVLLCIALVANGTSAVFASTKMALGAGMEATTVVEQHAQPPCHDMPAMAADHVAPAPPLSHDDCCPPGACLCSCVSHAPSIVAFGAFALPMRPSSAPAAALRVPFASPALPQLIRPPIG